MVIGGAEIYAQAMPLADQQVLTEVHASPDGDTHYPSFPRAEWGETRREPHERRRVRLRLARAGT